MVSADTHISGSSGNSRRSLPAMCSGDHHASRPATTWAHNTGLAPSLVGLGRRARPAAARCATTGAYPARPPRPPTSREIVEVARPSRRPITANDSPLSNPSLISTRSCNDSRAADTDHCSGRNTPPSRPATRVTDPIATPTSSMISRYVLPCAASWITRRRTSGDNFAPTQNLHAQTATNLTAHPTRCVDPLRPPPYTRVFAPTPQRAPVTFDGAG